MSRRHRAEKREVLPDADGAVRDAAVGRSSTRK